MDTHDLKRQQDLINALIKSKEKARLAFLYLTVNDRDPEDIANAALAAEHIDIALHHLGIETEGETDGKETDPYSNQQNPIEHLQ